MNKTILSVILMSCFMANSALAAGYKCHRNGNEESANYLLVLNLDKSTGAIFSAQDSSQQWNLEFADAKVAVAMDGGPTSVVGRDETKVDWSKTKDCYKFLGASLDFTVRSNANGVNGRLRMYPNMQFDPDKTETCSFPRLMLPPPIDLECKRI